MPFYQMLCITAHYPKYQPLKDLVRETASHVLNNGGVVRKISSWGTLSLPQRMRRHKQYHYTGDYWTMNFDVSPRTLREMDRMLRRDPRVIRWTMLKQGEKVEDIVLANERTRV